MGDSDEYVICRYITRNGRRIYPKNGRFFKFKKTDCIKKKNRVQDDSSIK